MGEYVDKYKPILGLENWTFLVCAVKEPDEEFALSITWVPPYRTGTIAINLATPCPEISLDLLLEECVIHEMCHAVQAPITDLIDLEVQPDGVLGKMFSRSLELQTEHLCSIVYRLQKKLEEAQKE